MTKDVLGLSTETLDSLPQEKLCPNFECKKEGERLK